MTIIPDEQDIPVKLDLESIKNNLPQYSSTKLCEMIVCDRYFGFDQKIAIMCMEELSKRRADGDTFIFEDYIEQSQKQLPPLNFNLPDLRSTLQQMIGLYKKDK